jgi:glycopeptide antibiotics resistance protein
MAANKRKRYSKLFLRIVFIAYLLLLFYFLFFSEKMGRMEAGAQYRYNLKLFQEIKRFFKYREIVGYKAFFTNVFGNIIAFVPFGMLMPRLSERANHWFFTTILALELSFVVEAVQLIWKLGCFDVDDLLLNTIGGLIGYWIFYLMDGSRKRHVPDEQTETV